VTTAAPPTSAASSTTSSSSSTEPTTTSTSVTTTSGSSSSNTTAITIAVVAAVALALLIGLIVLIMRRRSRSRWWTQARLVAAEASAVASAVERALPLLREPNAAVQVWADINSRITQLRGRLGTIARSAPETRAKAVTSRVSLALDAVQSAIDTDRGLRIGPPAPTPEQIGYSEALLRQRATELERTAQELEVNAPTS
jgi:hypothetical protein